MFTQHLKQTGRKLSRNKVYSVINIVGLTVAITAALLIYSHISTELKTDKFHPNAKNIYRVITFGIFNSEWSKLTSDNAAPFFKAEIPGIENYVRARVIKLDVKSEEASDYITGNNALSADPQFFSVFNFPLVSGSIDKNPQTPWIVISAKAAKRYFGDQSPIGKTLTTREDKGIWKWFPETYTITAVMQDIPAASTIQADFIINAVPDMDGNWSWSNWNYTTYLQLSPHTQVTDIEKAIPVLYSKYSSQYEKKLNVKLQALEDCYFDSDYISDTNGIPQGSKRLTLILCGITLLVLTLAGANYLLIKIAQTHKELAGLAVQKCYGAGNRDIARQLFTEIGLQACIALVLAIGLTFILHPYFIQIISPKNPYSLQLTFVDVLSFTVLFSMVIILIGITLYSFITKRLNKNGLKASIQVSVKTFDLKKALAITQMCIFCSLLCCSAIIAKQMSFTKNKNLYYSNDHIITTSWSSWNAADRDKTKTELMRCPDILTVSNGTTLPDNFGGQTKCVFQEDPDNTWNINEIIGDADYLDAYQIKLEEGRLPNKLYYETRPRDSKEVPAEVLVNRKFVEKIGLKQAIGTIFKTADGTPYQIVGVVKDFHGQTLYKSIAPLFISYNTGRGTSALQIRYRENKRNEAIGYLKTYFASNPSKYSEFAYSEYLFSDIYYKDIALTRMIHIFTALAIFISGMGIFAFSLFLAENRRKEVAIRKVNGATEWQVVQKLSRNFVLQTLIACGVAIPAAYFAMQKWLQGFAYKTSLDWWYFALFIALCIGIVLSIISWQVLKAALQNPVKSIKSE